jgi:hypothetical protein
MNPNKCIQKYGGKGAGLIWLTQNKDLGYRVPHFSIIDTSFYEECLKQELLAQLASQIYQLHHPDERVRGKIERIPQRLEEKCKALARKFKGRKVSVRSSAVVSEDSNKFSGAGMYDTFFLDEVNEETLTDAVLKVYASVNSPRAVQYRKEAELENERMAVVVQEVSDGVYYMHGVMQSRLQDVERIIPISFSENIGAVVRGDKDSKINTVYFRRKGDERAFASEDILNKEIAPIEKIILPIILGLRKRYGKEFEAEFAACLRYEDFKEVNLLQIRPLTNISDKKVEFPKKKPIFTTGRHGLCMGVGEYIGPWVTKRDVGKGWDEPEHYAYVTPSLGKYMADIHRRLSFTLKRQGREPLPDYDLLTPKKRAMILTHQMLFGSHALTIAHEKGILCIGKNQDEFAHHFSKPDEKVSPYIHIVSDGITGRVYEATKEEAEAFAKKMEKE